MKSSVGCWGLGVEVPGFKGLGLQLHGAGSGVQACRVPTIFTTWAWA